MKLYHSTTVYQLLSSIAHVQQNNSFCNDILLLSPWMKDKLHNIKSLKSIFAKVYYYDAVVHCEAEEDLGAAIDENIENFLNKNNIDLSNYDEILVGGVQYNFGIYLCRKHIPFSLFEESCGIISRPDVLKNIDSKLNVRRVALATNLNLYDASNDSIAKIYCDLDNQEKGFKSEKACDFKVLEILKSMDTDKINILLKLFDISNKISLPQDTVLLLSQQFANLKIMPLQDQLLIYQLFCDFFLAGKKIVIKPHPDDVCYYSQLIGDSMVIRDKFPSELMPFVFDNLPDTIATVSSTGIWPLKHLFKNSIQLDFRYEKEFLKTVKYFTAVKLLSYLNVNEVNLINTNDVLFAELANADNSKIVSACFTDTDFEQAQSRVTVIDVCKHDGDDIKKLIAMKHDAYIFLNTEKDFGFYRYAFKEIFEDIVPIVIRKKVNRRDDLYLSTEDEIIYVYSPYKEITEKMKEFTTEKELGNTGVTLNIASMTPEQLEIERLKGILSATEKRLLYYINKEKESEDKE